MIDKKGFIDVEAMKKLMDSYQPPNGKIRNKSNNGLRFKLVEFRQAEEGEEMGKWERISEWEHGVLGEAIALGIALRHYVNSNSSEVEADVCTAYDGQCSQCGSCSYL